MGGAKVHVKQQLIYVEFLEANIDFVRMKFNTNFTKVKYEALWVDLAALLNSCGLGSKKSVAKWKKSFSSWKSNTRAKASKSLKAKTGGGPPAEPLTDLDERLLAICLKGSATDVESVEEAGVCQLISETAPQPKSSSNSLSIASTSTFVPLDVAFEVLLEVKTEVPPKKIPPQPKRIQPIVDDALSSDDLNSEVSDAARVVNEGRKNNKARSAGTPYERTAVSIAEALSSSTLELGASNSSHARIGTSFERMATSFERMATSMETFVESQRRMAAAIEKIANQLS